MAITVEHDYFTDPESAFAEIERDGFHGTRSMRPPAAERRCTGTR